MSTQRNKTKATKTLKVFEAFAGIGAQATALERLKEYSNKLNVKCEIVGISDWYINALMAYDCLHTMQNEEIDCPTREEMIKYLNNFQFSSDSVNPLKSFDRFSDDKLKKLYKANKRSKNYGSITELDPKKLPDIDLLVYSFPCQDLSTGGCSRGMSKDSGTRSSLIWQIQRILNVLQEEGKLPHYLLLENVRAITSKRYHEDFNNWLNFLNGLGYINSTPEILNAKDYGIPQCRERAFVLSCLGGGPSDFNVNLRNKKKTMPKLTEFLRRNYDNLELNNEARQAYIRPTPSRLKMWEINGVEESELQKDETFAWTITCNFDRTETSLIIKYPEKYALVEDKYKESLCFRLLTNREAFLLMGFNDEEYERVKTLGLSYRQENKLIGNSIVVNVLMAIFAEILKDWADRS